MANLRGQNGSFLVLFRDDTRKEVFLVYRNDYPIWVLSGGGIEPNETPEQAAKRETFEEAGFKTRVVRKIGKYEFADKNSYLFEGRYVSGDYLPEFNGNIGKWFPVDHLPLDITSITRQKIIDCLVHQGQPFVKKIDNELPLVKNLGLMLRHPLAFFRFVNRNFIRRR